MPTLFKMVSTDPVVQRYLTLAERGRINPAQLGDAWNFEFHGGHETGTPFYIRPRDCTVKSNLSKFDTHTRELVRLEYAAGNLRNKEHVAAMGKADRDHLYAVLAGNWALLADLSRRFVAGDRNGDLERAQLEAEEAERRRQAAARAAAPTTKPCGFPPCPGNVPLVRSGKSACDTCWQYQ